MFFQYMHICQYIAVCNRIKTKKNMIMSMNIEKLLAELNILYAKKKT